MQDEYSSFIKYVNIWHNKSWIESDTQIRHSEKYNVAIEFSDN